jgi:hypothetical protein
MEQGCTQCGGKANADGLCGACRLIAFARRKRKYLFTEDLRAELRVAYAGARPQLSRSLRLLVCKTGWPRNAFHREAARMGLATVRPWSVEEDEHLRENLGVISLEAIARILNRTRSSVSGRAARLALSREPREGYSVAELETALGLDRSVVIAKMKRGLFGEVSMVGVRGGLSMRVSDEGVARFLHEHPHEYSTRRVDEDWFKAMMCGRYARVVPSGSVSCGLKLRFKELKLGGAR